MYVCRYTYLRYVICTYVSLSYVHMTDYVNLSSVHMTDYTGPDVPSLARALNFVVLITQFFTRGAVLALVPFL